MSSNPVLALRKRYSRFYLTYGAAGFTFSTVMMALTEGGPLVGWMAVFTAVFVVLAVLERKVPEHRAPIVMVGIVAGIAGLVPIDLVEPGAQIGALFLLGAFPVVATILLDRRWTWPTYVLCLSAVWGVVLFEPYGSYPMLQDTFMLSMGMGLVAFAAAMVDQAHQHQEDLLASARDLAQQGERAKTALLHVASHELKTPLNGVVSVQELLADTSLSADQRELLAAAQASAERLHSIVGALLDVAEGPSSQDVSWARVVPGQLASSVAQKRGPLAEAKALSFDLVVSEEPLVVFSDGPRVVRILDQLVDNAVSYTQVGQVVVRVDPGARGGVEISVIDTGPGIPPARLERLFRPFEAVDGRLDRSVSGLGLGLSQCGVLATELGPNLTAVRRPEGGMIFCLRLPEDGRAVARAA